MQSLLPYKNEHEAIENGMSRDEYNFRKGVLEGTIGGFAGQVGKSLEKSRKALHRAEDDLAEAHQLHLRWEKLLTIRENIAEEIGIVHQKRDVMLEHADGLEAGLATNLHQRAPAWEPVNAAVAYAEMKSCREFASYIEATILPAKTKQLAEAVKEIKKFASQHGIEHGLDDNPAVN